MDGETPVRRDHSDIIESMTDSRPNKRPRLSVENADEPFLELTSSVPVQGALTQPHENSEIGVGEIEDTLQATQDVDMDLQPSSQPSERDGALIFNSQEETLSATLQTPISQPTARKTTTDQSATPNEKLDDSVDPQIPPPVQQEQQTQKVEQAVEDDDTEYDDPWFDAACLTTTDAGGNILPDHLPVPPSSTPGKKQDLERRRSSEIKRSQEGKAIRETYMRSQAAMAPVIEEKGAEGRRVQSSSVSTFSSGNGRPVPPVSEAAKAKAAQVLAEDPMDTFGLGPATKMAGPEEEDYFSTGFAPAGSSAPGEADFEAGNAAVPAFAGFQTGKGKKFAGPSEATKARIANMFAEDLDGLPALDDIFKVPTPGPSFLKETLSQPTLPGTGLATPNAQRTIVPAFNAPSAIETPTKSTAFVPHRSVSGMSSFQTASGAKVPAVSSEAKARALALFADEGLGPADPPLVASPSVGFSTPAPKAKTIASIQVQPDLVGPSVLDDSGVTESPAIPVRPEVPFPEDPSISTGPMSFGTPETPVRSEIRTNAIRRSTDLIKDVTNQAPQRSPAPQLEPFRSLLTPLPLAKQELLARPPASPLASPRLGIGLGMTPRSKSTLNKRPAFKTPFKPNSSSFSTPTMSRLPSSIRTPGVSTVPRPNVAKAEIVPVFDLKCPVPRQTMSEAGLRPQQYSAEEIIKVGCPEEIIKIDANNALFYHFAVGDTLKGPEDAFKQIQADGCSQIALKWVNNHWALILWKLASIVRAQPSLWEQKWTYLEVLRQLKYRYEREVNLAQRSAIKRMQEQDSPASLPMVLCVASITPIRNGQAQSGHDQQNSSLLELTDGWYRIKANADIPLQRAIEAGRLRVGYKIALAGARLDAAKDGTDVLDALGKSSLRIGGNSTSLVTWERRLGFSLEPFVVTMTSLTRDGGSIPLMAVKINRVYPLAYMAKEKGKGSAPWSEAEEFRLQEEWTQRYNQERERLREACDKRMHSLEDDLDRLKQMCDGLEVTAESIDEADVSDQTLEDYHQTNQKSSFLRNLSSAQILGLAQKAQEEYGSESSNGQAEVEDNLRNLMPPRTTRSFQVIRMEDLFPNSQGKTRTAQLQVWDAHQLSRGILKEAGYYLVSNLAPAQPASWCGVQDTGEIFLCTNRNTTWKRLE